MEQLILHAVGDYILQSDWMAQNKTKSRWPALCHALMYSLPFLLICSPLAWSAIMVTHYFIDRYRLARYVVWAKNFMSPRSCWSRNQWDNCSETGYPSDLPPWLAIWLMIIADNTMHLICNYAVIRWL